MILNKSPFNYDLERFTMLKMVNFLSISYSCICFTFNMMGLYLLSFIIIVKIY